MLPEAYFMKEPVCLFFKISIKTSWYYQLLTLGQFL